MRQINFDSNQHEKVKKKQDWRVFIVIFLKSCEYFWSYLLEFFWKCHWLFIFSKVNWFLTFLKPGSYVFTFLKLAYCFYIFSNYFGIVTDCLHFQMLAGFIHFQSQLIIYIFKVSWLVTFSAQGSVLVLCAKFNVQIGVGRHASHPC